MTEFSVICVVSYLLLGSLVHWTLQNNIDFFLEILSDISVIIGNKETDDLIHQAVQKNVSRNISDEILEMEIILTWPLVVATILLIKFIYFCKGFQKSKNRL